MRIVPLSVSLLLAGSRGGILREGRDRPPVPVRAVLESRVWLLHDVRDQRTEGDGARTPRVCAVVFRPPDGGTRPGLGATWRSAGLCGEVRPHVRRTACAGLRPGIHGTRVQVERTELAVCDLGRSHGLSQRSSRPSRRSTLSSFSDLVYFAFAPVCGAAVARMSGRVDRAVD